MDEGEVPTAAQIRAARAMLRMEQRELAQRAGVSVETIKRLEKMEGAVRSTEETIDRIRLALEAAGVEFTFDEDYQAGEGVRRIKVEEADWIRDLVSEHFVKVAEQATFQTTFEAPGIFEKPVPEIVNAVLAQMAMNKDVLIERISRAIEWEREMREPPREE